MRTLASIFGSTALLGAGALAYAKGKDSDQTLALVSAWLSGGFLSVSALAASGMGAILAHRYFGSNRPAAENARGADPHHLLTGNRHPQTTVVGPADIAIPKHDPPPPPREKQPFFKLKSDEDQIRELEERIRHYYDEARAFSSNPAVASKWETWALEVWVEAIFLLDEPYREKWSEMVKRVRASGEPGVVPDEIRRKLATEWPYVEGSSLDAVIVTKFMESLELLGSFLGKSGGEGRLTRFALRDFSGEEHLISREFAEAESP